MGYRLIKYEGKSGENKLDNIAAIHSLEGCFYCPMMVGGVIVFLYNDDSGKMLRSSTIEEIVRIKNQIKVVTRNSVFVFEELEVCDE